MEFTEQKTFFSQSKAFYLGTIESPYLRGGQSKTWDIYGQPCGYELAGYSIVARYGNEESNFIVYPVWMIFSDFTVPSVFMKSKKIIATTLMSSSLK
jgi:hypothetical protein